MQGKFTIGDIMEWNKETDYKFWDNSFYTIMKGCDIGLSFIYDLKINKVVVDEYNTSKDEYNYDIYINVDGEWEYEIFNEETNQWEFGEPQIKGEWIKMEFSLHSWERNLSDILFLMQHYRELCDMEISWLNHNFYYSSAFDKANEKLSKKAYECMCDYAQARYEYIHDL